LDIGFYPNHAKIQEKTGKLGGIMRLTPPTPGKQNYTGMPFSIGFTADSMCYRLHFDKTKVRKSILTPISGFPAFEPCHLGSP
jgi:hypothetical protein